jgi:hypothetical protein
MLTNDKLIQWNFYASTVASHWTSQDEVRCSPCQAGPTKWDLLLSWQLSMMKFSRAISQVKWLSGLLTAQPFDPADSPRELHQGPPSFRLLAQPINLHLKCITNKAYPDYSRCSAVFHTHSWHLHKSSHLCAEVLLGKQRKCPFMYFPFVLQLRTWSVNYML